MARIRTKTAVQGADELLAILAKFASNTGIRPLVVDACQSGANTISTLSGDRLGNATAIKTEQNEETKSKGVQVSFLVGPDQEHWYLKFFETGVQPFEMDYAHRLLRGGKKERVRTMKKEKKALLLPIGGGMFRMSAKPGGFAARPYLRNTLNEQKDDIAQAVGNRFITMVEALKNA